MTEGGAMETLSQATTRLALGGYVEDYRAHDGRLVCGQCSTSHNPAELTIDAIVRFEGDSNPDDEAIVYALDAGCGHRGLYISAYGSGATADDIAVVAALPDLKH
ncbi:MAG: hypothetical protein ABJH68_06800 [Ilumatobacter sp.]|uniref:hypothetical protein n=1 Tax=Ilumatobacter sp. TaxID=1967498 RepID=UPI00329694A7